MMTTPEPPATDDRVTASEAVSDSAEMFGELMKQFKCMMKEQKDEISKEIASLKLEKSKMIITIIFILTWS